MMRLADCVPGAVARGLRFGAVGAAGIVVQVVALVLLDRGAGLPPALATALAVEAAILHNYVWHERWTWADRPAHGLVERAWRIVRFNAVAGLVSMPTNVVLTTSFVGLLGVPLVVANLLAIASASLVTFVAAHRLVFVAPAPASGASGSGRILETATSMAAASSRMCTPYERAGRQAHQSGWHPV